MFYNLRQIVPGLFIVGFFIFFIPHLAYSMNDTQDSDIDGLTDVEEQTVYYTDPKTKDTDGDGYMDSVELTNGYSPRHGDAKRLARVDSDNDYLNDAWELIIGTDLLNPDSDGDLYLDGTEVKAGYDPLSTTTDKLEKKITVDINQQKLFYHFDNKELDSFHISGGLRNTPTPTGTFSVLSKILIKTYLGPGYNYPDAKWNLSMGRGYYIHGAYWHNNFGNPMSHGCVNVSYDDMEKLYWFAEHGTTIQIQ